MTEKKYALTPMGHWLANVYSASFDPANRQMHIAWVVRLRKTKNESLRGEYLNFLVNRGRINQSAVEAFA